MRAFLLFILIAIVVLPPRSAAGFASTAPRECRMCGPSCCCPEACEKMLQKKLASTPSRVSCCSRPASQCRIQSSSMDKTMGLEGQGAPVPVRSVLGTIRSSSPGPLSFRQIDLLEDFFCSYLKTVPTPPPRLSA